MRVRSRSRIGLFLAVGALWSAAGFVLAEDLPAVRVAADAARPAAGAATDTAAVTGPYGIGREVRDRDGVLVGRVTRLTTDDKGRSVVEVRLGDDTHALPRAAVSASRAGLVSAYSAADVKAGRTD